MVNDSFSATAFCGLRVEDQVPDQSSISRFRKELPEKKALNRLLKKINQQLKQHRVILSEGMSMVDWTITKSPWEALFNVYEIVEDRQEEDTSGADQAHNSAQTLAKTAQPVVHLLKIPRRGSDQESAWVKRAKNTTMVPKNT